MELSRKEYPAILASLPPAQAVAILNERIRRIGRINQEVAEWIEERRRIEEIYAQSLKKLSRRQPPDESSDLGILTDPWANIVRSTQAMAASHQKFAHGVDRDVERPLKEFMSKNREMQNLSTIQGNLAAMAKRIDSAADKVEKLKKRGAKSPAGKVASAQSELEEANAEWESQAPFVFENLQAVDETRINCLRDVLTQFQTHEVDQVDQVRAAAEQCLNSLLALEAPDEISGFVARVSAGRPTIEGQRTGSASGTTLAPPLRTALSDDNASQRSGLSSKASRPELIHETEPLESRQDKLSGFRRLGTVITRRKSSGLTGISAAPPIRRTSDKYTSLEATEEEPPSSSSSKPPAISLAPIDRLSVDPESTVNTRASLRPESSPAEPPPRSVPDHTPLEDANTQLSINGSTQDAAQHVQGNLQGASPSAFAPHPDTQDHKDSSLRSTSIHDAISLAQQEAMDETPQNTLKLDIRSTPIQEEDDDAETALATVAQTLRAQAALERKAGMPRGRRDVRNTVFVPSPPMSDVSASDSPLFPSIAKMAKTGPFPSDEQVSNDGQSVRSSKSQTSLAGAKTIRHPELAAAGLTSSVVEAVTATFVQGQVSKTMVRGEMALAYHAEDSSASSSSSPGSETIRLENFHLLEKVAPNPGIITPLPDRPGEYTVRLGSLLARTVVAFKYQVHVDDANQAAHVPIILSPTWKIEPHQASVILHYSLNPLFLASATNNATAAKTTDTTATNTLTFRNVSVVVHLEGAKPTACQSKPVGTFSRDRCLIFWQLGEVKLAAGAAPSKLLARFTTEAEAKAGPVEARWEISGDDAAALGSRLSLSRRSSPGADRASDATSTAIAAATAAVSGEAQDNPFADNENGAPSPSAAMKEVPTVRRLISGKYTAT